MSANKFALQILVRILFVIAAATSTFANAKTMVIFVNGIQNSYTDMYLSEQKLKEVIGSYWASSQISSGEILVKHIKNPTGGFFPDNVEMVIYAQNNDSCTKSTNDVIGDESAYIACLGGIYVSAIDGGGVSDTTNTKVYGVVKDVSDGILNAVNSGYKVIVVAHSEGNYVAEAANAYTRARSPSNGILMDANVRFIGVASVAPSTPNGKFISLVEDRALAAWSTLKTSLGLKTPKLLPNAQACFVVDHPCFNALTNLDSMVHNFVSVYLSDFIGDSSDNSLTSMKQFVSNFVRDAYRELNPPAINSLSPTNPSAGAGTTFIITGTNLPPSIKMSIGGIDCTGYTNVSPTGFTATCTPGGTAGQQQVIVTDTSTGSVIDSSKQVTVNAAQLTCTPPQTLQGGSCIAPSTSSSNNLLLGSTVTDSCGAYCQNSVYGDPNLLVDGDIGHAARNLGTYSGSFTIVTAAAISLDRLIVYPNMTPNGTVSYEIQTSTDAAGASGSWTSYGTRTSVWTSEVPFTISLGSVASGVRAIKIIINSSPSWVAFYEFEGYLGSPAAFGTLNPANGHRYAVLTCGTWTQCNAAAKAKGGNLVTIRNADENTWLFNTFLAQSSAYGMWIGFNDVATQGVWQWTSGESSSYTNWYPGQPDNYLGIEHYGQLSNLTTFKGFWADVPNDHSYGGVASVLGIIEFN